MAEQPHVQLAAAVEQGCGEFLQLNELRVPRLEQAVQQREQILPQEAHVPRHNLLHPGPALALSLQISLEARRVLAPMHGQQGDFF